MAERYYPNEMPDFSIEEFAPENAKDSLSKLLSLPYDTISQRLKQDAINLKDEVVRETWAAKGRRVNDYRLYTGTLGTAYLLFKSYQITRNNDDLALCSNIIQACDAACDGSGPPTFIGGHAGIYALGAVVAKNNADDQLCQKFLTKFKEIKLPIDLGDDLFYGRAGYLWACSFLNKHLGKGTISISQMRAIVNELIKSGRKLSKLENLKSPLMYESRGKRYWGAAHGLAGVVNVLLDMELKQDESEYVKGTLRYMIKNRFSSGNYRTSEGDESDVLVHWCHGAPGVALTLAKAAKVFGDEEFLEAAREAGEVVWKRGLLKRIGICHGISGNAYVFLSLYRLTGKEEYLYKAKAFACFLHDRAHTCISEGIMHKGDHPLSLFEGIGGMAYLFLDLVEPSESRFPAYEL
ncbi:lanC-like protein GCR2 [Solanum dulcamara]|uniref:lanC-like protein GCR2 n=1 Tax=Solanum dulcamara TaxID=45834 RepID=UPI0024856953|nr:lanC-like protein GCR2 [Solanum dulcamara]